VPKAYLWNSPFFRLSRIIRICNSLIPQSVEHCQWNAGVPSDRGRRILSGPPIGVQWSIHIWSTAFICTGFIAMSFNDPLDPPINPLVSLHSISLKRWMVAYLARNLSFYVHQNFPSLTPTPWRWPLPPMILFGGRQSIISMYTAISQVCGEQAVSLNFWIVSQLYPSLWWYTIGVSKAILIKRIVDVPAFSSTDIWTRGRLMPMITRAVVSLVKMGSIVWIGLGEQSRMLKWMQENYLIWGRGNAGPLWLFYTSLCVAFCRWVHWL
jgi:hypothetical protein